MMAIPGGLAYALAWLCVWCPMTLGAQTDELRPVVGPAQGQDSSGILAAARAAQSSFEWMRTHLLPLAWSGSGGRCDERIGRLCYWYDDGDWHPRPEAPRITRLRDALIERLDSLGALLPGNAWILGQRVWYRAEAGRWDRALAVARGCGGVEWWWCDALEGFALHGLGRYQEAEHAFGRSLALMDSSRAAKWRIPARALDGKAAKLLKDAPQDSAGPRLRRLWALADPLYLVPGNDRETAHYARWTVAHIREKAHNPHGMAWGSDLEELLIRDGWEVAWERQRPPDWPLEGEGAIGHDPAQGRHYLPSGAVLSAPYLARAEYLEAEEGPARGLYAPPYAPVLLPIDAQVAVFPGGDRFVVVAGSYLPADTSTKGDSLDAPLPLDPDPLSGEPDQSGLFLVHPGAEDRMLSRVTKDGTAARLLLGARAGRYVLSVESWSPTRRLAGRYRTGLVVDSVPRDVATLSDLLLLEPSGPAPRTLRGALPHMLVTTAVERGHRVAVAWEVGGLGWRPEEVRYRLSVDRADGGLLRKAGRWLHLVGDDHALVLSWTEPGPPRPEPQFRCLTLELPELDRGRYRVRLEAHVPGRSPLVSSRTFEVVEKGVGSG